MRKVINVKVSGMHCPSCEKLIAMALEELPEVTSSDISAAEGKGTITFDDSLKTEAILFTIKKAGYGVELLEEENEAI